MHLASNLAAVEGDPKQVTPIPSMGRNLYLPTCISLIFYGFDVDKLYRSHGFYGFLSYIVFVCFGGGHVKIVLLYYLMSIWLRLVPASKIVGETLWPSICLHGVFGSVKVYPESPISVLICIKHLNHLDSGGDS